MPPEHTPAIAFLYYLDDELHPRFLTLVHAPTPRGIEEAIAVEAEGHKWFTDTKVFGINPASGDVLCNYVARPQLKYHVIEAVNP